jgi:hypothetical protein
MPATASYKFKTDNKGPFQKNYPLQHLSKISTPGRQFFILKTPSDIQELSKELIDRVPGIVTSIEDKIQDATKPKIDYGFLVVNKSEKHFRFKVIVDFGNEVRILNELEYQKSAAVLGRLGAKLETLDPKIFNAPNRDQKEIDSYLYCLMLETYMVDDGQMIKFESQPTDKDQLKKDFDTRLQQYEFKIKNLQTSNVAQKEK